MQIMYLVYQNISKQLAKENKKFQYKLIKNGARASAYEEAIEWLCLTGLANRVYRLEQIKLPLNSNSSINDFKFYMSDVGLCCASQGVLFEDIISEINGSEFRGGLAENYVNNQLQANGITSYYWKSKFDAKVDFIIRLDTQIIPIEVKSNDNVKSKSLNSYKTMFNPAYSIRISTKNFGLENGIKSVPLYAAFCIK